MPLFGPKGRQELNDIEADVLRTCENSEAWRAAKRDIPGMQNARLESTVSYEIIPLSVRNRRSERVPCDVPAPCWCDKDTWLQTYRVKFSILIYAIHPGIAGWDPYSGPDGAFVPGRSYQGGRVGSFTVTDEEVTEMVIRCPEGYFDLPNYRDLAAADLFREVLPRLTVASVAMLGIIEPSWITTELPVGSMVPPGRGKRVTRLQRLPFATRTVMGQVREVTAEEAKLHERLMSGGVERHLLGILHLVGKEHTHRPARQSSRKRRSRDVRTRASKR